MKWWREDSFEKIIMICFLVFWAAFLGIAFWQEIHPCKHGKMMEWWKIEYVKLQKGNYVVAISSCLQDVPFQMKVEQRHVGLYVFLENRDIQLKRLTDHALRLNDENRERWLKNNKEGR